MMFRVLGPLEVSNEKEVLPLGGIKQRVTLGYMLLRANRIVAISWLLGALWPHGDAPASAKKILQNAVSRLRSLLNSNFSGESVSLTTQPPGYILRVQDDLLDLNLFNTLTEQARAKMSDHSPQEATLLFKEALALWRGPALVDLVEAGTDWPELSSVQNSRVDALEDLFEAELLCGRHQRILPDLEQMARSGELRERSCGQLMLALYRSGRQADALNVYGDMRRTMVEELGLEPSRNLQELQQAILNQSDAIASPRDTLLLSTAVKDRAPVRDPFVSQPSYEPRVPEYHGTESAAPVGTDFLAFDPGTQNETVSVALIRIHLEGNPADSPSEGFHSWSTRVSMLMGQTTRLFGGTMVSFDGSVAVLMFRGGTAASKATRAAACIQDLVRKENELDVPGSAGCKLIVSAAVATDDVWFRQRSDTHGASSNLLRGPALDISRSLLEKVLSGEIHVCDNTRRITSSTIEHSRIDTVHGKPSWLVRGLRLRTPDNHSLPLLDREAELSVLQSLLDRTRNRSRPHMVTVLGEQGIGKSHLMAELVRRVEGHSGALKVLSGGVPNFGEGYPLATESKILCDFCDIGPRDSTGVAGSKLHASLLSVMDEQHADRLMKPLMPLIVCDSAYPLDQPGEALSAWQTFLHHLSRRQPVMTVVDDLHRAPEEELRFFEGFTQRVRDVPFLLVCSARPELLHMRPYWGGGRDNHTVLTLDPLSDHAIDKLTKYVFQDDDLECGIPLVAPSAGDQFRDDFLATPDDLRSYTRTLLRLSRKNVL